MSAVFLIFNLYCWFYPENFSNGTYGYFVSQKKRLESFENKSIDTLILGDSTASFNIAPKILPNSQALSLPGSTFIESYYLLRKFLEKNPPPKRIVWSGMNHLPVYQNMFWHMFVAERFYGWAEIWEIYQKAAELKDYPMLEEGNQVGSRIFYWKKYLIYILKLFGPFLPEIQVHLYSDSERPMTLFNQLAMKYLSEIDGHIFLRGQANYSEEVNKDVGTPVATSPLILHYRQLFLNLCQKYKIPFYFVVMPTRNISESEGREKEKIARKNAHAYANFQQTDQSTHSTESVQPAQIAQSLQSAQASQSPPSAKSIRFLQNIHTVEAPKVFNDSYFYDFFHLNAAGSTLLTQHLLKELNKGNAGERVVPTERARLLAFDRTHNLMAFNQWDKNLNLVNFFRVSTETTEVNPAGVTEGMFSQSGYLLALASFDRQVKVYSTLIFKNEASAAADFQVPGDVYHLEFDPSDRYLFVMAAEKDGEFLGIVYDLKLKQKILEWRDVAPDIKSRFSSEGRILVFPSIRSFSWKELNSTSSSALSKSSKTLISSTLPTSSTSPILNRLRAPIHFGKCPIEKFSFQGTSMGTYAYSCADHRVYLGQWGDSFSESVLPPSLLIKSIIELKLSDDGRLLAVMGIRGRIKVLDTLSLKLLISYAHKNTLLAAYFDRQNPWHFVSLSLDESARISILRPGDDGPLKREADIVVHHPKGIVDGLYLPREKRFITQGADNSIMIHDIGIYPARVLKHIEGEEGLFYFTYSEVFNSIGIFNNKKYHSFSIH